MLRKENDQIGFGVSSKSGFIRFVILVQFVDKELMEVCTVTSIRDKPLPMTFQRLCSIVMAF